MEIGTIFSDEVSWRLMSVIVLAGTIGAGKSSLTEMMAKHLGGQAFYESIEDNEVLPLFYANPEQYAFLLQIYFLNMNFLPPRM